MTGEEIVARLEAALDRVEADIQRQIDGLERDFPDLFPPHRPTPMEWTDKNGRYVLLDALCALAQAKAALA